jgi:SAM-dependent methyltransferase
MNDNTFRNAKDFFKKHIINDNISILDVGSYDVNGTLRGACPEGSIYVGIDIEYGKNVDFIINDKYEFPFENNKFDAIVTSSCFEHCDFFWLLFLEMVRCCKPGGFIYINVPSTGHYHAYPDDNWRFYPDSGSALARWGIFNGYNIELVETYVDRLDKEWNHNIIVIQKKGE